jgi:hypothetical protein
VIRDGIALTTLTPMNSNFNPANAGIDEDKYHLVIRAFLHPDLSGDADTQHQRRYINDDYFGTHLTHELPGGASLVLGADLLYGHGQQTSLNGNDGYTVPLDGSVLPPPTTTVPVNEIGTVNDRRWDIIGGLAVSASYHDARFTQYEFFDGTSNVEVGGNQLTLSPHILAAAGVLYIPNRGVKRRLLRDTRDGAFSMRKTRLPWRDTPRWTRTSVTFGTVSVSLWRGRISQIGRRR